MSRGRISSIWHTRGIRLPAKRLLLALCLVLAGFAAHADRVKVVYDDREAFRIRADMIRQARSEIFISYFIVRDDTSSVSGFGLLLDAADRGVRVRVMLDGFHRDISRPYLSALVAHPNIEIRDYNRFSIFHLLRAFRRTHEKIILADRSNGEGYHYITGGRNISNKYFGYGARRNFHDLDVYVSGESARTARNEYFLPQWKGSLMRDITPGAYSEERLETNLCPQARKADDVCTRKLEQRRQAYANALARIDERLREMSTGQVPGIDWHSDRDWSEIASDVGRTRFLFDPPGRKKSDVGISRELYDTLALNPSMQRLVVLSPYVILTGRGEDLVAFLVERGVRITLLTNSLSSTDNLLAQAGYANEKKWLLAQGVELYHYVGPDTIHAKALFVDNGKEVLIGSYNFDPRSAKLNREVGAAFDATRDASGAVLSDIKDMMTGYLSRSHRIGTGGVPVGHSSQHPNAPLWKKVVLQLLRPIVALPFVKNNL